MTTGRTLALDRALRFGIVSTAFQALTVAAALTGSEWIWPALIVALWSMAIAVDDAWLWWWTR